MEPGLGLGWREPGLGYWASDFDLNLLRELDENSELMTTTSITPGTVPWAHRLVAADF